MPAIIKLFIISTWIACCSFHLDESQTKKEFGNINYQDISFASQEGMFHYIASGNPDGPVLAFIHGSPGGWSAWKEYLKDPDLRKTFYMISIDRRGYGGSSSIKAEGQLKAQTTHLHTIIKQILQPNKNSINNNTPVVLIGHSFGGPVAVKYAMLYPYQIDAVVLVASPADPNLEQWKWYNKLADTSIVQFFLPDPWNTSNFELKSMKMELQQIQPDWNKIQAPILVVHGQNDYLVPVENTKFIQTSLSQNQKLEIISRKQDNHFLIWNNRKFFQQSLLNFLRKQNLI